MGDQTFEPAKPPELEWGLVPETHRHIQKRFQESNYAQAVEGGIDSSHVGILHSLLSPPEPGRDFRARQVAIDPQLSYLAQDTAPKFYVRQTDYGMVIGARRKASDEDFYWRITQFLAPFYTMIAPRVPKDQLLGTLGSPSTITIRGPTPCIGARGSRSQNTARSTNPRSTCRSWATAPIGPSITDRTITASIVSCSVLAIRRGSSGIGLQDSAIQETMGPVVDRSREMLGSGDAAIVAWRKFMLSLADELERSGSLSQPSKPEIYRVRSAGIVLPKGLDFVEGAAASG